jgi:hypothetical protein
MDIYLFVGVVVALLSGIVNNFGNLYQKKAINDYLQSKLQYIQLNVGDVQIQRYAQTLSLSLSFSFPTHT